MLSLSASIFACRLHPSPLNHSSASSTLSTAVTAPSTTKDTESANHRLNIRHAASAKQTPHKIVDGRSRGGRLRVQIYNQRLVDVEDRRLGVRDEELEDEREDEIVIETERVSVLCGGHDKNEGPSATYSSCALLRTESRLAGFCLVIWSQRCFSSCRRQSQRRPTRVLVVDL